MIDRDKLYIGHIAECIERIEKYAKPGRDYFMGDTLVCFVVKERKISPDVSGFVIIRG